MSEYAEFTDVDNDWTHERLVYYADQWMPYSSIYRRQNLGEEVRELRAKVARLDRRIEEYQNTLTYWRGAYGDLADEVAQICCLYGWGEDGFCDSSAALDRVRRDIISLRFRVHVLKKRNKKLLAWKQKAVRLVGPFAIVDTE